MAGQHDLGAHFGGALHDRVEVLHLEPEQHAITIGFAGAIADKAVMMFDVKAVQLQDELAILHQLLVVAAAVRAAAVEQALIPPAVAATSVTQMRGWGRMGPTLTELLLWRAEIKKFQNSGLVVDEGGLQEVVERFAGEQA
jgi:hypothetical protein